MPCCWFFLYADKTSKETSTQMYAHRDWAVDSILKYQFCASVRMVSTMTVISTWSPTMPHTNIHEQMNPHAQTHAHICTCMHANTQIHTHPHTQKDSQSQRISSMLMRCWLSMAFPRCRCGFFVETVDDLYKDVTHQCTYPLIEMLKTNFINTNLLILYFSSTGEDVTGVFIVS